MGVLEKKPHLYKNSLYGYNVSKVNAISPIQSLIIITCYFRGMFFFYFFSGNIGWEKNLRNK